ncbi:MAG: DUF2079 domain-containing protein [Myxococcota bacterium]
MKEASKETKLAVAFIGALGAMVAAYLGLARYLTFHNQTFDLAFYSRMAWGLSRGDFWEPIVGAHVFGLHLSPVVVPLGFLGRLFGTPEVLLVTQAAVLGAAVWPMAGMAHRRFGQAGAIVAGVLWFLYPNLIHVASYEFHPGTLAVLPLALLVDGIDRKSARTIAISVVLVLLCREDFAAMTLIAGLLCLRDEKLKRVGAVVAAGSALWLALFIFYFHPTHAPAEGSLELHFGKWGGSLTDVALTMLTDPAMVLDHLSTSERLTYLPRLLAPLALLPLFRPRWLLMALPVLAVNFMSEWPTTVDLDSHYQTPLLPVLFAAAFDGAERLQGELADRTILGGLGLTAAAVHLVIGGGPLSLDFQPGCFTYDERSAAAEEVLALIPDGQSVQAPYALMPHLSERQNFGPTPPPDRDHAYVVLDAWHRHVYAHNEDLLRTDEEPIVRSWLAREDYGLLTIAEPYLVLQRGAASREGPGMRHRIGEAPPESGRRLAACLRLIHAEVDEPAEQLRLELVATAPCPADLAVRIGVGERPLRVDLLVQGELSPASFRRGDRLLSVHPILPGEREAWEAEGLRVGLLRSSGARPEHADPKSIPALDQSPVSER